MTSTAVYGSSSHQLHLGQGSRPVALSSVQLPTQPSSSTSSNASEKYRHVLTSKAISPQMDLVAILSRDVESPASVVASGSSALNPSSVLAPPPPGMSAAANQARIRMMMMARARALAAAGLPANGAGPSVEAPKVTRCAPIRLSLWRMASLAGEQGSRVWDVELKVPSLFEDAGKEVKEMEDLSVSSMSWSPDCRSIALTVLIRRRRADGLARRQTRFLVVYEMQDGRQKRVIRIPSIGQEMTENEVTTGLEWCQLVSRREERTVPGSAMYILKQMRELPDNSHFMEEKDTKAKQRQRAFNAMRNTTQKQGEADRKLKEEMLSDSGEWSTCLLDYPRSDSLQKVDEDDTRNDAPVEVLCAWEGHRLNLFLDATIYLGSIGLPEQIQSVNIVSRKGHLLLCTDRTEALSLHTINFGLDQQSSRFSTLLNLQSLSTLAFNLLTYCYDSIVDLRNLYRNTHINCITPWFRKGKNIEMQYSTHFQTEMQILLLTSSANEAITSLLVGNETMTEGDLNKMKAEIASAWLKSEALFDSVFQALQRLGIVFEELRGCWLWQERYSTFLPNAQGQIIEKIIGIVSRSQEQSLTSMRHVQQEMRCWAHFYKWFKYERTRQEAIRDQVAEPKSDITYDVLLIADFLKRGSVNYCLEESIGITLDKKTRGTFVENEDEEEEETGDAAINGQDESNMIEQTSSDKGSEANHSHKEVSHDDLLEIQKQMRQIPDNAKKQTNPAPSQADLSSLFSSPFLVTGPSKGLQERRHLSSGETVNVFATIKETLELSSALFYQAFAGYASQEYEVTNVDVTIRSPLMTLRSDALLSVATMGGTTEQSSQPFKDPRIVRSCFDQITGQQWLLGVHQEIDRALLTIIKHSPLLDSTQITSIQCQGKIIDMGFYSSREVVLLLQDGIKTSMLSFQLNSLDFTPSQVPRLLPIQRSYEMLTDEVGTGALQLSLNHAKDVAATLDDKGSLIYWDFVQLGETKDEDHEMGSSIDV